MASSTAPVVGPAELRSAVPAVLRRFDLWPTALRQWIRLVPSGWWRRFPFLPLPSRAYLEFRFLTAYGSDVRHDGEVDLAADLVAYLEWCRRWPGR